MSCVLTDLQCGVMIICLCYSNMSLMDNPHTQLLFTQIFKMRQLHWLKLFLCRLLTMERLHGVPLTDLAAIRSITSADPEQTLITALNTWFGSVLGCETFHADVHAGQVPVTSHAQLPFFHHACMPLKGKSCTAPHASVAADVLSNQVGPEMISRAHLHNVYQQHCQSSGSSRTTRGFAHHVKGYTQFHQGSWLQSKSQSSLESNATRFTSHASALSC